MMERGASKFDASTFWLRDQYKDRYSYSSCSRRSHRRSCTIRLEQKISKSVTLPPVIIITKVLTKGQSASGASYRISGFKHLAFGSGGSHGLFFRFFSFCLFSPGTFENITSRLGWALKDMSASELYVERSSGNLQAYTSVTHGRGILRSLFIVLIVILDISLMVPVASSLVSPRPASSFLSVDHPACTSQDAQWVRVLSKRGVRHLTLGPTLRAFPLCQPSGPHKLVRPVGPRPI